MIKLGDNLRVELLEIEGYFKLIFDVDKELGSSYDSVMLAFQDISNKNFIETLVSRNLISRKRRVVSRFK